MTRIKYLPWLLAGALALPLAAQSAELELEWQDPERFSDVESANEPRERYRERVLERLESYFADEAEKLPDDQTLHIKVTNVDLAGVVEQVPMQGGLQQLRILRSGHSARIDLEYRLEDENGNILQEGEERLRSRSPADSQRLSSSTQTELRLERDMIQRWFRATFDS